ncbi:MAG TPA: DCC1-like thiol-disulfide oxidoreductase family protein [Dermatophilaceae bacterium]|nr:DCC1-like thiol-disulfide oxidoreductase family protein [Dermatophilaceae bacterium]
MSTPVLPVLVFDGDCGFCTSSARFAARWVIGGRPTTVAPWQRLDVAALGLTTAQCREAAQWVGKDGQVSTGHLAIAAALRSGHLVWRPLGALIIAPGFSWLAGRLYAWVADHRYALPGGTPACRTDDPG